MSEFLGTMVLILFGDGVVAMVVALGKGDCQTITWAWGLAVVMGVYVAGGLSGAHINPAVTAGTGSTSRLPMEQSWPVHNSSDPRSFHRLRPFCCSTTIRASRPTKRRTT